MNKETELLIRALEFVELDILPVLKDGEDVNSPHPDQSQQESP
jgi:hypothetical protein